VGSRLNLLIEKIRVAKGPFFVARLGLRVKFTLSRPDLPDNEAHERELLDACRALGFDPSPLIEGK
jgi:hypothetical protein